MVSNRIKLTAQMECKIIIIMIIIIIIIIIRSHVYEAADKSSFSFQPRLKTDSNGKGRNVIDYATLKTTTKPHDIWKSI